MIPNAYATCAMTKSTETIYYIFNKFVLSLDRTKTLDMSSIPKDTVLGTSDPKSQKSINDHNLILFSDGDSDNDSIESNINMPTTISYNNNMKSHMIKYAIEVMFVEDRYTTLVAFLFSLPLKLIDNTSNIAATRCKLIVTMKILDSSVKIVA